MSRPYTLHGNRLIGTCPICGGMENFYGEARKIDLREHRRTPHGEFFEAFITGHHIQMERCPGSGISVQLKAPAGQSETSSVAAPSDDDIFPFGKHKGVRFGDVPADYLDWLSGQGFISKFSKIVAYIAKNRASIYKDLENAGKI